MKVYEKMIPTMFVEIEGEEFEGSLLVHAINEMLDHTSEDDRYGDYSLRDYELYDPETTMKLVKLGYVKNYTGSRMANLFCTKDTEKLEEIREKYWEALEAYENSKEDK